MSADRYREASGKRVQIESGSQREKHDTKYEFLKRRVRNTSEKKRKTLFELEFLSESPFRESIYKHNLLQCKAF